MRNGQRFSHPTILLLVSSLLSGCAGLEEAYESRVCWDGNTPGQCKEAYVQFTCDRAVAVQATNIGKTSSPISTRLMSDMTAPRVGQLFSQYCPPNCIPIMVKNRSPFQTLQSDLEEILERSGYNLSGKTGGPSNTLEIDLLQVDVRSDDPGWTSMKIKSRADVAFKTRLVDEVGNELWVHEFRGAGEVAHAYAALSDYQSILSKSYCAALDSFSLSVSEGNLNSIDGS